VSDVEAVVREHSRRVVAGEPQARADLAPGATVIPEELLDQLLAGRFAGFELVAHARIGAHHIFKTRYVGPTTVVVQARWTQAPHGAWQVREAEIVRVEPEETT
jgi:hypothetical protein